MNVELILLHNEVQFLRLCPILRTSNRFLRMAGHDQEDGNENVGVLVDWERVSL